MPAGDIETLKRIYAGWERGDFTVGVTLFDPGAVLVMDPELPDAGTYGGLEGIRDYTRRFLEAWQHLTIAAESYEQAGDKVLVEVRQTGVGADSGVPVGLRYFHLWTLRDGAVTRLESVKEEDRARELLAG